MDTRWEAEHFRLFSVFLTAGLLDMGSESLNFSNASNTEEQMKLYPKTLSDVWLPHDQLLAVIKHRVTHSMLNTFGLSGFGPELEWEGLGLYI